MRSHPEGNLLGAIITEQYQSLLMKSPSNEADDFSMDDYLSSEWVATDRINAETGQNFTSWKEHQGPIAIDDDNFALTQQYNSSDPLFTYLLSAYTSPVDNITGSDATKWSANDIVILTDGICGSTCSLFVEMMREQGVRSVSVGGLPEAGPMQAASGSRGAAAYTNEHLYNDYDQAREADPTASGPLPQLPSDTVILGFTIGFTLRDQIRANASTPNQVLYLPANCRLYWTFSNIYNLTQLWTDAHDAIYVDPSRCVLGSVNATEPSTNYTTTTSSHFEGISHSILKGLVNSDDDADFTDYLDDSVLGYVEAHNTNGGGSVVYKTCRDRSECNHGDDCYQMEFACDDPSTKARGVCSRMCRGKQTGCGIGSCDLTRFVTSKLNNVASARAIKEGICHPSWTASAAMKCSALDNDPTRLGKVLGGSWRV
jgi:hypothetical protein